MEELALYFLWSGFVAAGVASVGYGAYLLQPRFAFLALRPIRMAATGAGASADTLTIAAGTGQPRPARRSPTLGGAASLAAWSSVAFGGLGLIFRTVALDHAPFSNLFEFSMAFGFSIALVYVLFELRTRAKVLGAFVMPVSFGLYASALAFPSDGQQVLVPALQNPTLLSIHVATMLLAYGALAVAFGAAVMHLVQGNAGRRHTWLPPAQRCDELTYRAVLVGFPILAGGVALGALWANDAWGRYWGWDPKETAALVTWLIFAVYLHTRGVRQLRGARGSWVVVLGFLAVLFTYLGVNLWVSGLHSYAGV